MITLTYLHAILLGSLSPLLVGLSVARDARRMKRNRK